MKEGILNSTIISMVRNRQEALEIAAKARKGLEQIYSDRLRGVYLYGSAARDQITPDSDIDIAVILDRITSRYLEHKRTSKLGSDLSLDATTLITFLFVGETDFKNGRFSVHQAIKSEGIRA